MTAEVKNDLWKKFEEKNSSGKAEEAYQLLIALQALDDPRAESTIKEFIHIQNNKPNLTIEESNKWAQREIDRMERSRSCSPRERESLVASASRTLVFRNRMNDFYNTYPERRPSSLSRDTSSEESPSLGVSASSLPTENTPAWFSYTIDHPYDDETPSRNRDASLSVRRNSFTWGS